MMIHDNILNGQFLLDIKKDHNNSLLMHHASHQNSQFHTTQHQGSHYDQLSALPAITGLKMDLYTAYAYQQQLKQSFIGQSLNNRSDATQPTVEVLDLSRRCDSVETTRKTPSPYHTNSSFANSTPATSPTNQYNTNFPMQTTPPQPVATAAIPANLLYSAVQAQTQQNNLTSLYPALYFQKSIKQEEENIDVSSVLETSNHMSSTLATPTEKRQLLSNTVGFSNEESISQGTDSINSNLTKNLTTKTSLSSPTPLLGSPNSGNAIVDKSTTRPFKAFPRDPLVIAANFAATDVLLDNPRAERYTEYRKRVLEQIRNSNGGSRTVTNPKMRRTNSRSGSVHDTMSYANSECEERRSIAGDDSDDSDMHTGNFDKNMKSTSSTGSVSSNEGNSSNSNNKNNPANAANGNIKDAAYYERRRKNNAAAKKSRDRRRIKEDEIAIRAAYLERQNIELLCQIDSLKAQLAVYTAKMSS